MNTIVSPTIIEPEKFSARGEMAYSLQFAPPSTFGAAISGLNEMGDFFEAYTSIENRVDRKFVNDAATTARFLAILLEHHYALVGTNNELMDRIDVIVDAQPYWEICCVNKSLSIVEVVHVVSYLGKTASMINALVEKSDASAHGFGLAKLFSKKR